ncbi:hypothetical protein [Pseudomonas sp. MS15a(2019)]|uniref:hypothetical protein n=1 Tax=Pseudomonas sp. MS15a(2019) TaxID=2579938 RepID=UPI001565188B|nr:hypothetical protein [Pseudomonas sp. MS15a(2019)]NRH41851.1 hypothetical protein [Pseudomonas sp. MS15a(2019)]
MSKEVLGIFAIALMIIGEGCIIYAELAAARLAAAVGLDWHDALLLAGLACFSGLCLLLAYGLGYRATGDIWVVAVVSVLVLLVCEPLLIWLLFQELPGRGALVGSILGALGLAATAWL